jgi:hypothetical protein
VLALLQNLEHFLFATEFPEFPRFLQQRIITDDFRYLFRRDDPTPAPWTDEGKALIAKKGFKCVFPEGHLEAQAAKKAAKEAKATEAKGKGKGKKGGKRSKASSGKTSRRTRILTRNARLFKLPANRFTKMGPIKDINYSKYYFCHPKLIAL